MAGQGRREHGGQGLRADGGEGEQRRRGQGFGGQGRERGRRGEGRRAVGDAGWRRGGVDLLGGGGGHGDVLPDDRQGQIPRGHAGGLVCLQWNGQSFASVHSA